MRIFFAPPALTRPITLVPPLEIGLVGASDIMLHFFTVDLVYTFFIRLTGDGFFLVFGFMPFLFAVA